MTKIVRIKGKTLTVTGIINESANMMNSARYDANGNLYIPGQLIEDGISPVRHAVDNVYCSEFWEGKLWTPPPPVSLYIVAENSSQNGSYIVKMNLEDLSVDKVASRAEKFVDIATDGSGFIYAIAHTGNYGAKITKDNLDFQLFSVESAHNTIVISGDYIYSDLIGSGGKNAIKKYTKDFNLVSSGPEYSDSSKSIYKDLVDYAGYFYLFDFYGSMQLKVMKIDKDTLAPIAKYSQTFQYSYPEYFVINDRYAYITGENHPGNIWKFNLLSMTLHKHVVIPHNMLISGITILGDTLYICSADTNYSSPRIYKYSTNLDYITHADFSAFTSRGLNLITNYGTNLYALTYRGIYPGYNPTVLKLSPELDVLQCVTLPQQFAYSASRMVVI